jgi:hypothetical protein
MDHYILYHYIMQDRNYERVFEQGQGQGVEATESRRGKEGKLRRGSEKDKEGRLAY